MIPTEVLQLELLADMDALKMRLQKWIDQPSSWEPVKPCQLFLKRVSDRVESLRVRMESPLVVATFGGTGTGKSSLVNALVGQEVTTSGRQRPTTTLPVVIAHSQTALEEMGFPLDEVKIVRNDADLLRDVVIVDCPDPDTEEDEVGNTERLRKLLPFCDVLIYVSTQQKYKSARVNEELKSSTTGCRIIFVQTHADLDSDIRQDWKQQLSNDYTTPEVYFVDSLQGMKQQRLGQAPTGDLGRLIDLLRNKLGASERVRVRRANVLELFQVGLKRCQEILAAKHPDLQELIKILAHQNTQMRRSMSSHLEDELLSNRSLWEKRLLARVIDQWGLSPFAVVLRTYAGIGNLIASSMLFRVRSVTQLAILGTVQGVRWASQRNEESSAEASIQRLSAVGIDDTLLRSSEIVIRGQVTAAGLHADLLKSDSLMELRRQAVQVEHEFMGDVSQKIDGIIHDQAAKKSHQGRRLVYEIILSLYLGFVLFRVGKNFFYDSLVNGAALLPTDFYIAAILFLLLICGGLLAHFNSRLQNGLSTQIRQLTDQMTNARLALGLFPQIETEIASAERIRLELNSLLNETERLRTSLVQFKELGGRQIRTPAVKSQD